MEDHQGEQRSESGRRQPRQNRQRMNVAFVQYAKYDVHDHDGDREQDAEILERVLKRLGRALEAGRDGRREHAIRSLLHFADRITQRHAGLQVE